MKKKSYDYKSIHLKKELKQQLDFMRREYGFTTYTELLVYLYSAEKNKKNCCRCK